MVRNNSQLLAVQEHLQLQIRQMFSKTREYEVLKGEQITEVKAQITAEKDQKCSQIREQLYKMKLRVYQELGQRQTQQQETKEH